MSADRRSDNLDFLAGDTEMARRMRAFEWTSTPLGPPEDWPAALKAMVRMALLTRHPVFIFWGAEHTCLYNDAYSASLGPDRHPSMLGRPGQPAWHEIWHIIGPQIAQVMRGDGATWHENQLVPMLRNGVLEDVYWTYSYAPIHDELAPNRIGGVLVLCTETTQQVLTRQRLSGEHQRLNTLFEQAPIFMALLSGPEHTFELANPAYLRLVGRDVLGKSVQEALPESIGQGYLELLDKVYGSGEPFVAVSAEYTPRGNEQEPRFLDFVYQPVTDPVGAVTGIFVVGSDVTDRHRALRALEFSEEQLRLATEAAEIGFWDVDLVNETLFWPPRVKAMFGIAAHDKVSMQDFYNGLHPQDRQGVTAAFAAACDPSQRAVYDVEYRTIGRDDGVVRWVDARGRGIFRGGRCVRVVGAAIDITRRKHDEQRLKELNDTLQRRLEEYLRERKLLADLVEGTDAFVQVADLHFNWLAINRAGAEEFERIFGKRPAVGLNMLELLQDMPEHQQAVREVWLRAIEGDEFVQISDFGDESLDRRSYEMHFRTLFDADGHRIGAYQFVYDVTERQQDQRRLAQAEAALHQAQKMEAIGQLTGGLAHDFNNLLQALHTGFELLKRRPADVVTVLRLAEKGLETTRKASRLTNQLLTFSRRQSLDIQALQLDALVHGMEELIRSTVGSGVRLHLGPLDPGLWVHADATQLEMALLNLAINARDAMPAGGELFIDGRVNPSHGGLIDILVRDTGLGMSKEVAARAFDPFFTTKDVGKGSGLGLSQVYAMATRDGGNVRLDSTPGAGTTVTLSLRRAEPIEATPASPRLPSHRPQGLQGRIIVVDDDAEVRAALVAQLQSLGHEVLEASNGEHALEVLQGPEVDVMLLDFAMPGMTGAQVAVHARKRNPELNIVFMSGYSDTAAIADAVGAGAVLLRKPFDFQTLDDQVQAVLRRRHARAGLNGVGSQTAAG